MCLLWLVIDLSSVYLQISKDYKIKSKTLSEGTEKIEIIFLENTKAVDCFSFSSLLYSLCY